VTTKYTYSVANDTLNGELNQASLFSEILNSSITVALDHINSTNDVLDIWFKSNLVGSEWTTLSGVVAAHTGAFTDDAAPRMDDGRPIVRADTRPLHTNTYFTTCGDGSSGIGDGAEARWNFSNDDDVTYDPTIVPSGMKAKQIDMTFNDPIYIKEGTVYFFDAPWESYLTMEIVVASGSYYPNPYGSIPASALGLSGDKMYAHASDGEVIYTRYVNKHFMCGSCPMGDELNTEGCQTDPLPVGWKMRINIITPDTDDTSKGFAEIEVYRARTCILPGDPLGS
jgi:hypothetical protein